MSQNAAEALGTEKLGKLLFQYSLPAIIAMTASSLYNITDRIFIGHGVGALAISGLALTLPLMNLAIAFGALAGAGFLYLVLFYGSAFYGQDAMGEGDLNLIAMVGAFLGWRGVIVTILIGCLSGSTIGLALIGLGRLRRQEHIPLGPFLALGAGVALFFGEWLIAWYFGFLR